MRVSAATIYIPQVTIEADQKPSFGRIPHVFHNSFTIHNLYPYLNNRPHQLIEINIELKGGDT